MAQLVRRLAPRTKIVIGGHGVNVPDIEKWVEHDYLCRGEGVRFLRRLFGEEVERPIEHPIAYSAFNRQVMGVPLPRTPGC